MEFILCTRYGEVKDKLLDDEKDAQRDGEDNPPSDPALDHGDTRHG